MSQANGRALRREPVAADTVPGRTQSRRITEEIEDELRIRLRRQYARTGRVNIKAALYDVFGKLGGGNDHKIASRLADEMGFPRTKFSKRRERKAAVAPPTLAFPESDETPAAKLFDPAPWVVVVTPDSVPG